MIKECGKNEKPANSAVNTGDARLVEDAPSRSVQLGDFYQWILSDLAVRQGDPERPLKRGERRTRRVNGKDRQIPISGKYISYTSQWMRSTDAGVRLAIAALALMEKELAEGRAPSLRGVCRSMAAEFQTKKLRDQPLPQHYLPKKSKDLSRMEATLLTTVQRYKVRARGLFASQFWSFRHHCYPDRAFHREEATRAQAHLDELRAAGTPDSDHVVCLLEVTIARELHLLGDFEDSIAHYSKAIDGFTGRLSHLTPYEVGVLDHSLADRELARAGNPPSDPIACIINMILERRKSEEARPDVLRNRV